MKYVVNSAEALIRGINKRIEVEQPSIYEDIVKSYGVEKLVAVNFPKRNPSEEVIALWNKVKPWVLWGSPTGRATFCPTSTPVETVKKIRNHLGSPIYCREAQAQYLAKANVRVHVDSDEFVVDLMNRFNKESGVDLPPIKFIDGISLISQKLVHEIFGEELESVSTFQFRLVSEYSAGVLRGTMIVVANGVIHDNEIIASKSCAKAGFDLNTEIGEDIPVAIGIMNLGRKGRQYLNKTIPFVSNSVEARRLIKTELDNLNNRVEEVYSNYKEFLNDNFDSIGDVFDLLPERGRHFHLSNMQAMAQEAYKIATSGNVIGNTWPFIWGYDNIKDQQGYIFYGGCAKTSHGMLMRESTHEKIKCSMKKLPRIPWIAGDQEFIIGCAVDILTVDCDGDLLTYFPVETPFTAELYKEATWHSVWNCGKGLEKKEYETWEDGVWANLFKVNVGAAFNSVVSVMRAKQETGFLHDLADKLLPSLVEINIASTNDLKKEVRGVIDTNIQKAYEIIKEAVKANGNIVRFFGGNSRKIAAFLQGLKAVSEKGQNWIDEHVAILSNEGRILVGRRTRKHDVADEMGYPLPDDVIRSGSKSDAQQLVGQSFVAISKNSKALLDLDSKPIDISTLGNICFNLQDTLLIESSFVTNPFISTGSKSKVLAYIRNLLAQNLKGAKLTRLIAKDEDKAYIAAARLAKLYKSFGVTFMALREINKFYRLPVEEYQMLKDSFRARVAAEVEDIAAQSSWRGVAIAAWNMMGTDGTGMMIIRLHADKIIPIIKEELTAFDLR